jgi:hypothetical protein
MPGARAHHRVPSHAVHADAHDGPTTYKADPIQVRKFRFQNIASGSTQFSITRQKLLSLFFCNTSGTVNFSAMAGIKIRRIQVWGTGPTATSLNLSPISLQWISENAPEVEISAAGNGNHPSYITSAPPEQSLAGYWSMFNSANLSQVIFQLNLINSEIVDLEVEYTPANGAERIAVNTTASGTPGFYYYGYLDGQGASTGLVPVSNPSLT